jgi:hypothetical protein
MGRSSERHRGRRLSLHPSRLQRAFGARRLPRRGALPVGGGRRCQAHGVLDRARRGWLGGGTPSGGDPDGGRGAPAGVARAARRRPRGWGGRAAIPASGAAPPRGAHPADQHAGARRAAVDRRRGLQEGRGDGRRREPRGDRPAHDGEPPPPGSLHLRRGTRRVRPDRRVQLSLGLGHGPGRGESSWRARGAALSGIAWENPIYEVAPLR